MKQFIFLFLLTVLLGCTGNKRVNDNPLANDTDTVMVSKGYDEVKLFKTRTGHITATISVNGKPCVFLIDVTEVAPFEKFSKGRFTNKT